ncbi:MAG: hypothetical protein HY040_14345 [Planctomycetes bacterium]|nr:hypothetical protein [Planctomycetota bacterium]
MIRLTAIFLGLGALLVLGDSFAQAQDGQWGTVKGRIVWGGKDIPEAKPIAAVDKSADKAACCKNGPVLSDTWVVDKKSKGLKWTFVWLAPEQAGGKVPIHPSLQKIEKKEVDMDQPACMFTPHAVGLREGQILLAKNSAAISHNYKWTGNPTTPNSGNALIVAGGSVKIDKLVADRLPIQVECNIHGWMRGWVRVFDHPYFAVTDANGNFELKNAPAGKYRLMIWHGSGGWLGGAKGKNGQVITIPVGKALDTGELKYVPPAE